jgi:hypothetical protein
METDPRSPKAVESPPQLPPGAESDLQSLLRALVDRLHEAVVGEYTPDRQSPLPPQRLLEILVRGVLDTAFEEGGLSTEDIVQVVENWRNDSTRALPATDLPGPTESVPKPETSVVIDPALLEDVEGFVNDAEAWFHTPNPEFEGRKPIELLGTPDEAWLRNRIDMAKHGMFS